MRQVSQSKTRISPVGGINALDPLSGMAQEDAIIMRDMWPSSYGVSIRRGSRLHAGGFNGPVNTIFTWKSAASGNRTFAVDNDGIYNIDTIGDVSGTPDVETSNSFLQHVMMANAGGTNLIAFNGVDDGFWYDESGWKRLIAGDGTAEGTWSGIDPALLIQCTVHQRRVWAVEKDSSRGWYLPPDQIYGVAEAFDFGGNFTDGGYLQALCTWSRDGGDGMDDYLLAISSSGQVAVYGGIDPSTADTWQLVGVYFIGPTFTRRCWAKYGSDVAMITKYGVVTMNSVMASEDGSILSTALSRKIQTFLSDLTTEGALREGWEVEVYSPANMILLNIPGYDSSQNIQLVLNTISGSWSTFTRMPATCWARNVDTLFYGTTGSVYRFWEGWVDHADYNNENGESVIGICQQAFSHFDMVGHNKHFKLIRPTFLTTQPIRYNIAMNIDYKFDQVLGSGVFGVDSAGAIWDVDNWDEGFWGGGSNVVSEWSSLTGIGFVGSVTIRIEAASEVIWASTDILIEGGGPI